MSLTLLLTWARPCETLPLSRRLQQNVTFAYYPASHMVYLNVEALRQFRSNLKKFYEEA